MEKRIKELVELLNKYRNSYYNENKSLVSDKEYDMLFDELKSLEEKSGIVYSNSPTVTIGYEVMSNLPKIKHDHLLASLDKTTEMSEFKAFFGNKESVVMAKLDGLTCALYYEDGKFIRGESRGNGEVGEDITHNIKAFANVPMTIPFKGKLWVDGEAIIDYATFERINEEIIKSCVEIARIKKLSDEELQELIKEKKYKNPRNLASGSVRQLDSNITAARNVQFIGWKLYKSISDNGTRESNSHSENLKTLQKLGFTVVPCAYCNNAEQQFEITVEMLKAQCESLGYPIDGMVAMFDDIQYGESLGMTSHHPGHSIAYKFYQERTTTTLIDIEWSTSRTGMVNPVAIFEPVEIDGTTVSRATLNNISIIEELELGLGDEVSIIKANQIIPQIVDNFTRSNTYEIPTVCPDCGSPTIIKATSDRKVLYCTNKNCPSVLHDKLSNFCSRDGMNIVGLSEERLRMLMNLGYIKDFGSVYTLKEVSFEIEKLDGFGKSSVAKLLKYIEESKICKLSNVLTAIGIPGVGKSSAKSIAKFVLTQFKTDTSGCETSFDKFITMSIDDFEWFILSDFGEVTSKNINNYVKQHISELTGLSKYLEIIDDNEDNISNNILGGKTFCVTGKLYIYDNRDSLVADIEKYGGKIVSGVTSKTNYLITNDKESGSSKNEKAKKYGTKIITEEEFQKLLK